MAINNDPAQIIHVLVDFFQFCCIVLKLNAYSKYNITKSEMNARINLSSYTSPKFLLYVYPKNIMAFRKILIVNDNLSADICVNG